MQVNIPESVIPRRCRFVRLGLLIVLLFAFWSNVAHAQEPEFIDTYVQIAEASLVVGRYEDASRYIDLVVLVNPQDRRLPRLQEEIGKARRMSLSFELASLFEERGNDDSAIEAHLAALDQELAAREALTVLFGESSTGDRANALCALASLYFEREAYAEAQDLYRRVIRVDPANTCWEEPLREIRLLMADAYAQLAQAFMGLGLEEEHHPCAHCGLSSLHIL